MTPTALKLPRYVATEGAVEQFSHVLVKELGLKKITVNVVSPGLTDTELFSQGTRAARSVNKSYAHFEHVAQASDSGRRAHCRG
jgi:short-subunit dehydrogenase